MHGSCLTNSRLQVFQLFTYLSLGSYSGFLFKKTECFRKETMVSILIDITSKVESAEQPDIATMSAALVHHHHVTL